MNQRSTTTWCATDKHERMAGRAMRQFRVDISVAGFATLAFVAASCGFADEIIVHSEARASGEVVRLADVADLHGDSVEQFAALEVAPSPTGLARVTVSLGEIRRALSEAGAHMGLITCRGSSQVVITRGESPVASASRAVEPTRDEVEKPVAQANPLAPLAVVVHEADQQVARTPRTGTLGDLITHYLIERLNAEPADLRVSWVRTEADVLNQPTSRLRVELEPIGNDLLGRTSIAARLYSPDGSMRTERVSMDVRKREQLIVAADTIARGQTITSNDLRSETQWLDSALQNTFADAEQIIGQSARTSIRAGRAIHGDDIEPLRLIKRGQLVTVRTVSGGLVIKSVARAKEDGVAGQLIAMENERTRQRFAARVTGPQQAVMMLDATTTGFEGGDS